MSHSTLAIFEDEHILFKDIFDSTNQKLQEQMQRYKGLDHPFEVGDHQLAIDNKEFELLIETDMPNMVIFTFNEPQNWDSDFNIYKSHSGFTVETQHILMTLICMEKSTFNFKPPHIFLKQVIKST